MRALASLIVVVLLLSCASVVTSNGEPAVDLCDVRAIDANAIGVTVGRRTVVPFDQAMLEDDARLPPSSGCGRALQTTRRLVLRYRPTSSSPLRVVAHNTARIDRIVALDGCGAAASRLACSGTTYGPPDTDVAPLLVRTGVRAGVPLTILVALDEGTGAVTFDEVPDVARLGERCDDLYSANLCEAGTSCGGGPVSRCVRDGGPYTACRRAGAPCDPDLICVGASRDGNAGRCMPGARIGEECTSGRPCFTGVCAVDAQNSRSVCAASAPRLRTLGNPCTAESGCAEGLRCAQVGPPGVALCWPTLRTGSRCVATSSGDGLATPDALCPDDEVCFGAGDVERRCRAFGRLNGPCRDRSVCDDGLLCTFAPEGYRCVQPPPVGQPCDPSRRDSCLLGSSCVSLDGGPATCRLHGSLGAACAGDRCDAGLICRSGRRCAPPTAVGANCDAPDECGPHARCLPSAQSATSQCFADGAEGGSPRAGSTPCDSGLAVGVDRRCHRAVGVGGSCVGPATACAATLRCDDTCRATGADGGYCRATSPSCDDGLACASVSFAAPPVCVRALHVGDACAMTRSDGETPVGDCVSATNCASIDGESRCAPLAPSTPMCAPTGPACPSGMSCQYGVCVAMLSLGERCRADAYCPEDSSCDGAPPVCTAFGSAGRMCRATGAPCDPGLICVTSTTSSGSFRNCQPIVSVGAPCGSAHGSVCGTGASCLANLCARDGSAGGACRDAEDGCDGGLPCADGVCARTLEEGATCAFRGGSQCRAGLACRYVDPMATCMTPSYRVEVEQGVAFEDPCLIEPAALMTPFVVRLSGEPFLVEESPEYRITLRSPDSMTPREPVVAFADSPQSSTPSFAGCARIVGQAPHRRLIVGGGTWARGSTTVRNVESAVIVYEESNVVEVRYAAPSPAGRAWVTPKIVTRIEAFAAPRLRPIEGTSVRFVPQ